MLEVMRLTKALGMIETKGMISSIEAADAMVKAADVCLVKQEKINAALITILVEGDVGAVQAALEAGKRAIMRVGKLVACHIIPHPNEGIKSMIQKEEKPS